MFLPINARPHLCRLPFQFRKLSCLLACRTARRSGLGTPTRYGRRQRIRFGCARSLARSPHGFGSPWLATPPFVTRNDACSPSLCACACACRVQYTTTCANTRRLEEGCRCAVCVHFGARTGRERGSGAGVHYGARLLSARVQCRRLAETLGHSPQDQQHALAWLWLRVTDEVGRQRCPLSQTPPP